MNLNHNEVERTDPARFDTDDQAARAAGEWTGEDTGLLEAVPGNQDDLIPSANPSNFSVIDATIIVDEVIDREGDDDELEAVVGLNSPIRGDEGPPSDVPMSAQQLPIADYDDLSVAAVSRKLSNLSKEELHQVERYEQSHRKRKTLLAKLERRLHNEPNKRSSGKKHAHEVSHADRAR